jgi:hypothetical protein
MRHPVLVACSVMVYMCFKIHSYVARQLLFNSVAFQNSVVAAKHFPFCYVITLEGEEFVDLVPKQLP